MDGSSTLPGARKLWKSSGTVAMTVLRDFAAAMDLDVGGFVEIEPVDSRTIVIRKAQTHKKK